MVSIKKAPNAYDAFGAFFWCATHGASLDGASPLWRLAVANH